MWELQSADDSSLTGGDLTANPITLFSFSPSPSGSAATRSNTEAEAKGVIPAGECLCQSVLIFHKQTRTHTADISVDEESVSNTLEVQPHESKTHLWGWKTRIPFHLSMNLLALCVTSCRALRESDLRINATDHELHGHRFKSSGGPLFSKIKPGIGQYFGPGRLVLQKSFYIGSLTPLL